MSEDVKFDVVHREDFSIINFSESGLSAKIDCNGDVTVKLNGIKTEMSNMEFVAIASIRHWIKN